MSALAPLPAPEPEDTQVDQEAVIKEARRRARRRRAAFAGAGLAALGTALGIFFSTGGPSAPHSARPLAGGGLPQAGTVLGTLATSPQETVLFVARDGALFVFVIEPGDARSITVVRVDRGGATTRERVPFELADYVTDMSAGPEGIYAGTHVIKRFTNERDELIRIDPITLTIRARAFFPSSVATAAYGSWVWAALGDGRVVRLDPRTLSIEASHRVLSAAATAKFVALLSKPAVGLGSVWVLAGNTGNLELVRMDPTTLDIRSSTRVPTGGDLAQALYEVSANSGHVYLVGSAVVSVSANGRLTDWPVLVPGLANARVNGTGLVGVMSPPGLVLLDPRGRIEARTRVADAGAQLAVSGRDLWFLGNVGRGNGLVHVRVRSR